MAVVESASITDVGRKRKGNEDSLFVSDDMRLYVVADGMGGHQAGEVASQIVVDTLRDHFMGPEENAYDDISTDTDEPLSNQAKRLLSGIRLSNEKVHQHSLSKASLQGMGSTVSAVLLTDETLIASNVGDSPIYLIRNGAIETLSVPHTMLAEYQAIAPEGAKQLEEQFGHVLTRAMGVDETVKPDIREIKFFYGDILVISSDGLSDKVSPEEILEIVKNDRPDKVCKALVDLANKRGGDDNITIVILHIVDDVHDIPIMAEEEFGIIAEEGETTLDDALDAPIMTEEEFGIIAEESEISLKDSQIAVDYDTDEVSHRGFIQNLSLDGVFIESNESFTVGEEIMLTFSVDDGQISFIVTGKVVGRSPEGIEVTFEDLTKKQQDLIKFLM